MQKTWKIKSINPQQQVLMSNELGIHPIIAQLLINRNITDLSQAKAFLSADLKDMDDPMKFKDMARAIERIKKAKDNKEKVLVFGDYDVDGVTSSTLLHNLLDRMGIEVINEIPHRMEDGYGLNHEVAEYAKENGVSLLITVDCGICAYEEVETINNENIDVIVIDHHLPEEGKTPNAYAIINPKQEDCPYPFKDFATVGLVAKLTQAVEGKLTEEALDLAAIGTIADIVPLRGENRIFVRQGLPHVHKTKNPGLKALLEVGKIKDKVLSPFHVGFVLGPRINAAGRMDSAHAALNLFLSKSADEAITLAKKLDRHNTKRQKMQRDIVQEALEIVEQEVNFKEQKVIVVNKEGWHKGVLGIVASKISDRYYRPAIVISTEDGVGTASARSIDGFHLHEALSSCEEVLEAYGGHKGAAGLTIKEENIDPFRDLINKVASKQLEVRKLLPQVLIDCEIPLRGIDLNLAKTIESLEPYGEGNPAAVFCSRQLTVTSFPQVLGRDTLKFWVSDGQAAISAVGFGMAKYKPIVQKGEQINLAYNITIDDWNKAPTPQLKLIDIQQVDETN